MAKIKIKIEKKTKVLPKEEVQEIEHEPIPSMTDVKGKRKTKTLIPSSPKVVRLRETRKKFQKKSLLFTLFIIVVSLLVLGLIIWFGYQTKSNIDPKLINFVPQEAIGVILGNNLSQAYLDFKDEPDNLYALSSLERTLKKDYDLDLEKDLISWMNREYEIIVMPKQDETWNVAIVFELDDTNLVREKLELIEEAISSYYAKTYPKEKEIVLKDRTKAIELLPDIGSYQFSSVDFEGVTIKTVSNIRPGFSHAFLDNKLVAANCLATVKSIISADKFKEDRLVNQENFKISYSKIPRRNNGILYIDIEKLSDFLGLEELKLFSPFKNFIVTQVKEEDIRGYLLAK